MGANHLESGIPLGTPGAILSSGLILVLNICVGLVVTCTMYAFYALFRKGDSRMGGNLLSNYGEAYCHDPVRHRILQSSSSEEPD